MTRETFAFTLATIYLALALFASASETGNSQPLPKQTIIRLRVAFFLFVAATVWLGWSLPSGGAK